MSLPSDFKRVEPKGEKELEALRDKLATEEKQQEEQEKKYEQAREAKIQAEIDKYYQELDLKQPGGPNPKKGSNWIRYDFTTGRRPYQMTTRGDIAYKTKEEKQYLQVYKLSCLFLPIPFLKNGGGNYINQYSISLEMMVDNLPSAIQALVHMFKHNGERADILLRKDGAIGLDGHYSQKTHVIKANHWHVLTITVDCLNALLAVYVDGAVVNEIHTEDLKLDGPFAVSEQVCIFGSKDTGNILGANIKWCLFEPKVLSSKGVKELFATILEEGKWNCPQCTFRNALTASKCTVCGYDNKAKWSCTACTFLNASDLTQCAQCQTPRKDGELQRSDSEENVKPMARAELETEAQTE